MSPEALRTFLNATIGGEAEPLYDQYREHLQALKDILTRGREANPEDHSWALEGNLFYGDMTWPIPDSIEPTFALKRRNFAVYATTGASMLEIGCNAGHSAMLALTANPDLVFTGVDLGYHEYTPICFDYLKSVFGSRVNLILGDSRDVVPTLLGRSFDLYHIDAGHGFAIAQADLCNVLNLARSGQVICFDDMDFVELSRLVDYYVLKGLVDRVASPARSHHGELQAFLRVI